MKITRTIMTIETLSEQGKNMTTGKNLKIRWESKR